MTANHVVELIPAFSLGSLDSEEAAQVRMHLADCRKCQAELEAYTALTADLAWAAPDESPPTELKKRLMARVQTKPATQTSSEHAGIWDTFLELMRRGLAMPRWQQAAVILIVGLAFSNFIFWQRLSTARQPGEGLRESIALSGTEAAPGATGVIIVSSDGHHGTLIVENLPELSQEQQYQLWLIRDGERTSGAVFSVNAEGYSAALLDSEQALTDFNSFGITIEPAGGSPGPTGAKVLGSTP